MSAFFLALILPMASMAKANSEVNLCYTEFREEMVTASLYTAKKQNLFSKNGVDVHWKAAPLIPTRQAQEIMRDSNLDTSSPKPFFVNTIGDVALLKSVDEQKCDFVSTTFEAILAARINPKEYVPVAVYQYGKNYDTPLVVRTDSDIKTIKDLKGKTVRFNQIGSLLPFEALLNKSGLKLSDVKFERSDLLALVDNLDDKQIDAVLSYNPTIPLLLGSGRVRVLEKNLFETYYATPIPHSVLLVKKEFMNKSRSVYTNFMKAFKLASDEIVKKPENIVNAIPDVKQKYSAPEIEKSLAFIQVGKPLLATGKSTKDFFAEARFTEYAGILKEHGFIKDPVDLSAWIY